MYFAYLLAAILPAVILLLYAYKQDQFPEPPAKQGMPGYTSLPANRSTKDSVGNLTREEHM